MASRVSRRNIGANDSLAFPRQFTILSKSQSVGGRFQRSDLSHDRSRAIMCQDNSTRRNFSKALNITIFHVSNLSTRSPHDARRFYALFILKRLVNSLCFFLDFQRRIFRKKRRLLRLKRVQFMTAVKLFQNQR